MRQFRGFIRVRAGGLLDGWFGWLPLSYQLRGDDCRKQILVETPTIA